jgi:YjbE family integral membrane protein
VLKTRRLRRPDDLLMMVLSCRDSIDPAQKPHHVLIQTDQFYRATSIDDRFIFFQGMEDHAFISNYHHHFLFARKLMDNLVSHDFWLAVFQIITIDILLGGDNAIVIALACRGLPERQRRLGILFGSMGAILIRAVLVVFALTLLGVPYLKLCGALLLLWIGAKLLTEEEEDHNVNASDRLWGAIKTIVIADLVMSVDNVVGVAAAAEAGGGEHKFALVVFGLLVSIPIVVWGSTFVIRLMERFPWVITAGAMLIGWIAGTMAITDTMVMPFVPTDVDANGLTKVQTWFYQIAGTVGASLVFLTWYFKKKFGSSKGINRELPP